jgi:hypothetical protein
MESTVWQAALWVLKEYERRRASLTPCGAHSARSAVERIKEAASPDSPQPQFCQAAVAALCQILGLQEPCRGAPPSPQQPSAPTQLPPTPPIKQQIDEVRRLAEELLREQSHEPPAER